MAKKWTEFELLVAMNLYCKIPFGKFDKSNKDIQKIALQMDRTPSSLSMKLCNLASLDSYHKERGVIGLKGTSKLDREVWATFQNNWSLMVEKSEEAFKQLSNTAKETSIEEEIQSPRGSSEKETLVRRRTLQSFFRKAVLVSYENRCALSGLDNPKLLNASHIIPWSENKERRADPSNGICLNALYDRAFDRGLITFDENYRLVLSHELKSPSISNFQSNNFIKIEGKKLSLPSRFIPDSSTLEYHRENIFVT